jgi:hypothetical protein
MPNNFSKISHISIHDVKEHYLSRYKIHEELLTLLRNNERDEYVRLALGITDCNGNYSAYEHKLGPRILSENANAVNRIFKLAQQLLSCPSINHIPSIIYNANILYLKISVGSEIAMMLRPKNFWVGNVRTIWAYFLIKHQWDYDNANEALELYKEGDLSSEMTYELWKYLYLEMQNNLDLLIDLGNRYACAEGIKRGLSKYLWADAIANQ